MKENDHSSIVFCWVHLLFIMHKHRSILLLVLMNFMFVCIAKEIFNDDFSKDERDLALTTTPEYEYFHPAHPTSFRQFKGRTNSIRDSHTQSQSFCQKHCFLFWGEQPRFVHFLVIFNGRVTVWRIFSLVMKLWTMGNSLPKYLFHDSPEVTLSSKTEKWSGVIFFRILS